MFRNALFNHVSASPSSDLIKLKNNSELPGSLFRAIIMNLQTLRTKNPIAFIELVQKCRDSKHEMFSNTMEAAQKLLLISHDGEIHRHIKDVISSLLSEMILICAYVHL